MFDQDYAQARKQYVEEVRRSFGQEDRDLYEADRQPASMSFFKLRLMIAACIFAAFVLCDRTGSQFYHYTTGELVSMIQKEQFQTQLDAIRQAWSVLTEKGEESGE